MIIRSFMALPISTKPPPFQDSNELWSFIRRIIMFECIIERNDFEDFSLYL